ncbi:transposase [Sphingomonas sp. SORGH_AS802]|uniref:transposase n=1 Tax=unclassified Sphingomonas TaxID=196159 RepID=UPI002854AB6A|nr:MULTISPECIES: transposase [unclassified Sphingomonas]MDR6126812.1 transposase [Sphingomonas sp. SORGH_AS_0438]MDR6134825.1 transposase [Sphingomonas sp. SORGH_AS_0802]
MVARIGQRDGPAQRRCKALRIDRLQAGTFHCIETALDVLAVGCRWCDCPADYGASTTICGRFNRWSRRGLWLKLLDALADAGVVAKNTAIDSTYTKVRDFQATVVETSLTQTVQLRGYLSNIPQVTVKGIEADVTVLILPGPQCVDQLRLFGRRIR